MRRRAVLERTPRVDTDRRHQPWKSANSADRGIEMPPLMFGGNVFGWTADEATSFRLLDALMDAGFNAIDTADVYSVWARGHQGGEVGSRDRQLVETARQARRCA